jgi:hypothetical protein
MTSREAAGKRFLQTAVRHLQYVEGDKKLGLKGRAARRTEVRDFYASVFGNLGMLSTVTELNRSYADISQVEPAPVAPQTVYPLELVIGKLTTGDPEIIFHVLESSQAKIKRRENREGVPQFFVDPTGVKQIVDYLTREQRGKFNYKTLERGLQL